ncbi:MAG: PEP-CTERM system TPR-repeat protein PrsT, partial [Ectothiorhodospiraceae bacterium]|nr:PEP-CTERM system TPR-repeat protein PrsT [Ectothiorhodospiraceae bacterium]
MKRLAKWLLTAVAAVGLAACGDSIDDYMDRGTAYQEEGRYQSAIAEYRNVLQEDSNHAEARFRIGEVSLLLGDDAAAEDALRRSARAGIDARHVQPLLATALLRQGKYEQVLEQIDPDSVSDAAVRAELLAAHAEAHAQAGRLPEARRALDAALDADRNSVRALVVAARAAQGAGQMGEAILYLERAEEVAPTSPAVWLVRAEVERQLGNWEEAIAAYRRSLEQPPSDVSRQEHFNARGRLVEALLTQNQMEAARTEVQTMLRQGNRHPYANYLAGLIALGDDDLSQANEHLQRVLSVSPDSVPGRALMGAVRYRQGQYAQAITLLQEALSARPDDLRTRLILVASLREAGDERQATRVLAGGVREHSDDPQALTALSQAAGDDIDGVIADLERRQAQGDTGARQARLGLAQALVGGGATDPAMAMLQQLETGDADEELTRRQFIALAALRAGDTDRALSEARSVVSDYPDRAGAHNLLGGIYLNMGRNDDARASFQRALELDRNSVQTLFNLGLLAADEGELDQAVQYFEQGLERSPGNLGVKLRLADVHQQRGDGQAALRWLNRAVESHPESPQAAVALARFQYAFGEPDEAVRAAERAVRVSPGNALALSLLGVAKLEAGDAAGAVERLQAAYQLAPEDPDVRFHLARAQASAGDENAAMETLQRLVEDYPERPEAPAVIARMQLRDGDHEAALQTARQLQEHDAGRGEGAVLEGHIHADRGDSEAAAEAYQRAVDEGRRDALGPLVAHRHELGMEDAGAPIEAWIENNPDDAAARLSLADWYGQVGDYAGMVRQYERLVEMSARPNAALTNTLAWGDSQFGD